MRKMLVVLGWVFLGVLVILGGFVGYFFYVGSGLDASSKAYVDQSVPAIVASWSKDELLRRASPELRKAIPDEQQVAQLFGKLSQLGKLERYEGSKGDANISVTAQAGKMITASYIANAKFEKGSAQITIRLIQKGTQWQILYFYVNSPIFLQ